MQGRDMDLLIRSKELVESSLEILEACLANPEAAEVEGLLGRQRKMLLGSKQSLADAIIALAMLAIKLDQHRLACEKLMPESPETHILPESDVEIIQYFISRQES